jgi:putative holliday junction resolvase
MGRIVAIDYGRVRIGLAASDPQKRVALPWKILEVPKGTKDLAHFVFESLREMKDIDQILIGHPLLMNGTKGEMALEVEAFVEQLKKQTSIPLLLWDERFTSAIAEQSLKEMGFSRKKRKGKTDTTAATLLLQSYLDSCGF